MYKFLFSLILFLLPFISFYFQRFYSVKNKRLKEFNNHFMVKYIDFSFIPFNVVILYSIIPSFKQLGLVLVISSIFNYFMHRIWAKSNSIGKDNSHFFDKNEDYLNGAGLVHLAFSVIEVSLILLYLISSVDNLFTLLSGVFLLFFAVGILVGSYFIHNKKMDLIDILGSLILIILVILRIISLSL